MEDATDDVALTEGLQSQKYHPNPFPHTKTCPSSMKQYESPETAKSAQMQQDSLVAYLEKLPPELRNMIFELTFYIPHEINLIKRPKYLQMSQIEAFEHGTPKSEMAMEAKPYAQWSLELRNNCSTFIDLDLFQEFYAAEYADDKRVGLMRHIGDANILRRKIARALSHLKDSDVSDEQDINLRSTAFTQYSGHGLQLGLSKFYGVEVDMEVRELDGQLLAHGSAELARTNPQMLGWFKFLLKLVLGQAYGPQRLDRYAVRKTRHVLRKTSPQFRESTYKSFKGWMVDELVEIVLIACLLVQKYDTVRRPERACDESERKQMAAE